MADLFDGYVLRVDGTLLAEGAYDSVETVVLDASTAKPLTNVTKAVGGQEHGCAIRGAGNEVWCWRTSADGNSRGQLGSGLTDDNGPLFRASAVLTGANTPLTDVDNLVGDHYSNPGATCAIKRDGTVYCWGPLGWIINGGTNAPTAYATRLTVDGVAPLQDVRTMALGDVVSCAITKHDAASKGQLWCWGYGGAGELGQGDTTNQRYPQKVIGLSDPSAVAVTLLEHTPINGATVCALDGVGVRCWGFNGGGVTATGSSANYVSTPSAVLKSDGGTVLSGVVDLLALGSSNTTGSRGGFCAMTADPIALCWGPNFGAYPTAYPASALLKVGWGFTNGPAFAYLSNDGVYHVSKGAMKKAVVPSCSLGK